jgi:hypothetical protein
VAGPLSASASEKNISSKYLVKTESRAIMILNLALWRQSKGRALRVRSRCRCRMGDQARIDKDSRTVYGWRGKTRLPQALFWTAFRLGWQIEEGSSGTGTWYFDPVWFGGDIS